MAKSLLIAPVLACLLASCSDDPVVASTSAPPPISASAREHVTAFKPETDKPKAYEGPFGLTIGLAPAEVKRLIPGMVEQEDGSYFSADVPIGHEAFESYVLSFSRKSGLCAIGAIGKDVESGQTGAQLRSVFDALSEGLTTKYGRGKNYDFATGLMDDPQYFMIALADKNRTLATFWDREEGSSLPPEIAAISLRANASDMSTGYVNLRYELSNINDCVTEEKAASNKAL